MVGIAMISAKNIGFLVLCVLLVFMTCYVREHRLVIVLVLNKPITTSEKVSDQAMLSKCEGQPGDAYLVLREFVEDKTDLVIEVLCPSGERSYMYYEGLFSKFTYQTSTVGRVNWGVVGLSPFQVDWTQAQE